MNRTFFLTAACAAFIISGVENAGAQSYTQTPVTISKEKIRNSDGKLYYSHVVLDKQTLFSIAKAYGVTVNEITAANPTLDLKTEGLKKNSILLIPVKEQKQDTAITARQNAPQSSTEKITAQQSQSGNYTIHVVKWYESLDDIAEKYSITKDILMKYNGLKSEKLKNRQKLRIPSASEARIVKNTPTAPEEKQHTSTDKKENPSIDSLHDNVNAKEPSKVNALLMLPFNSSSSKPSESNMDFYSGVLMAIKDLSENGINTDLSVYDISSSMSITAERLKMSDFSIGPVNSDAIAKVLANAPEDTYIISPLDHRTASMVLTHGNLIQAPTSQEAQYSDLIKWIKEERSSGDKVIVISEKNAKATAGTSLMSKIISESGLPVVNYSYTILQGRNVASALGGIITKTGANRVIINSESEAFVNDVVRNLDMLVYRKNNMILYSTSKIRSYETIDVENLHNLKTRISTAYYIDYNSPKVKKFLMEYRALYGTEPTQFSFQGYDLAYFMIEMKAKYGKSWITEIEKMGTTAMMQTDFMFREYGKGGLVNLGVRRIEYGSDFSIRITRR